ncbi:MAG: hypothetical protein E6H88_07195 [Chloroflexi bacterium]|nr:MAG: hypothetical protein E6H88_07195 [Chloroflexota bacterium]
MIGRRTRAGGFRRFYLYSALSIAVLAAALGIGALLNAVLRAAGVGTALGAADLSRTVSLTIAVLAFALPVGGVHLWLIARSLRDPVESGSEARHGYLNAWLLVALVVDLIAGTALISALALPFPSEPAPFIAALVVASAVGVAAWLWVDTTVPEDTRRRTQAARVAMAVTMTDLFAGELRAGLVSAAYALVLWTIALLRQWRWRVDRDRALYTLAFYGVGVALVTIAAALEASALIRRADGTASLAAVTALWPALAAGALLVTVHLGLLLADRGRNGHPAVVTDRLVLAFPAAVGLAAALAGIALAWSRLVLGGELVSAAALVALGGALYVPAWLALLRHTRTEPQSDVRRFYLFTVVCLALVATVLFGVVSVYNALVAVLLIGSPNSARDGLAWLGAALAAGIAFAVHVWLLVRDQRRTRTIVEPQAADPLVDVLEAVRAGRLSIEDAAVRIRGEASGPRG